MSDDIRRLLFDQALGGAVESHIGEVIRAAAATVRLLRPTDQGVSGMRDSQLRNVVNAAIGARSVTEIAAFILYQMGRSTNSRQWLYGGFGDAVVADLAAPDGAVQQAAASAHRLALKTIAAAADVRPPSDEEQDSLLAAAAIALARQYLGYLSRLFAFADKTRSWDRLGSLMEAQR